MTATTLAIATALAILTALLLASAGAPPERSPVSARRRLPR
jgi:hypothetical protein